MNIVPFQGLLGNAIITECPVFTKCFVECSTVEEESQQHTCPHVKHKRNPTMESSLIHTLNILMYYEK